ncbi:MAG TPA: Hsp20/alpha crystallin family protein [Patescibacteria group bacterium]
MGKQPLLSKILGLKDKGDDKLFVVPKDLDQDSEAEKLEPDTSDNDQLIKSKLEEIQDLDEWFKDNIEGQLAIDVFYDDDNLIIKSAIAGVKAESIDISLKNDMLTIRGYRGSGTNIDPENYICQECYWGGFSRSIILPVEVYADRIDAKIKNGILTVTLPVLKKTKPINIKPIEI